MTYRHYITLIDIQARMALQADASRYFLGYLWWILEPLLYVGVFYVVFEVILDSRRADFLVFLMCGKLPFMWFSRAVTQASSSIVSNAGLIGRLDVTKTLFPMAAVQESVYKQVAVFVLLIVVLLATGHEVSLAWWWLPLVLFANYMMIVACSLIGATLVCFVRDFKHVISLGMIFLLFTSGIFWDVRELDPSMRDAVLAYNPLAFVLDAYRLIFMHEAAPNVLHLITIIAVFSVGALLSAKLIQWQSQALALRAITA